MKLTPEQKAYLKGLKKSKSRKEQKRQFKLQNKFEYDKEMAGLVIEASERLDVDAIFYKERVILEEQVNAFIIGINHSNIVFCISYLLHKYNKDSELGIEIRKLLE